MVPGLSQTMDYLVHICKLQEAGAPFSQGLGTVGEFHALERSFLVVSAKICVYSG